MNDPVKKEMFEKGTHFNPVVQYVKKGLEDILKERDND